MNKPALFVATAVVSLAAGGFAGYYVAKHRLEGEMEKQFQEDLEVARAFYANVNKTEFPTPADAVAALIPEDQAERTNKAAGALRVYQGEVKPADAKQVLDNVFDREPPQDPGPETPAEGYPQVISEDVYMAGEENYVQVTLTYFLKDRVLVDERDEPVDLQHQIVGDGNLQRFHDAPHMSTLYVRNAQQEVDYEIVRSEGSYSVEVAGFHE